MFQALLCYSGEYSYNNAAEGVQKPPWCSPERHISKGKSQKRQKIPETSFQPFLLVL